jgi:hypothetical protein
MPGLIPGIHAFVVPVKTWMAGTGPAMTQMYSACTQTQNSLRADVPGDDPAWAYTRIGIST